MIALIRVHVRVSCNNGFLVVIAFKVLGWVGGWVLGGMIFFFGIGAQ